MYLHPLKVNVLLPSQNKCATGLRAGFYDGYVFMKPRTEEMFVLMSVQGPVRFPKCRLVLAVWLLLRWSINQA